MRKIIAIILVLAIGIPMATASLFFVSAGSKLLSRDFFDRALDGRGLERILRELPQHVRDSGGNAGTIGNADSGAAIDSTIEFEGFFLDGKALTEAALEVIPEGDLGTNFDKVKSELLDQIFSGNGDSELEIPVGILTKALEPHIPAIAARYAARIPATSEPLEAGDLRQRPAHLSESQFARGLAVAVQSALADIPPSLTIESGPVILTSAGSLSSIIPGLSDLGTTISLISAAFIFLLAFLFSRNWGQRLAFVGGSILPTGLFLLVFAGIFAGIGPIINAPGMHNQLGSAVTQFFGQIGQDLSTDLFLAAAITLVVGVALLFVGLRLSRSRRDEIEHS